MKNTFKNYLRKFIQTISVIGAIGALILLFCDREDLTTMTSFCWNTVCCSLFIGNIILFYLVDNGPAEEDK